MEQQVKGEVFEDQITIFSPLQGFTEVAAVTSEKRYSCALSTCAEDPVIDTIDDISFSCELFLNLTNQTFSNLTEIEQWGCTQLGLEVDCVLLSSEDSFFKKIYFSEVVLPENDGQIFSTPKGPSLLSAIGAGAGIGVGLLVLIALAMWSSRSSKVPDARPRKSKKKTIAKKSSQGTVLTQSDPGPKPLQTVGSRNSKALKQDAKMKYKEHIMKQLN